MWFFILKKSKNALLEYIERSNKKKTQMVSYIFLDSEQLLTYAYPPKNASKYPPPPKKKTPLSTPKKIFWGTFWHFWGGMHKSKVAQNPKICRKPFEFFYLSILCALKVHFLIFTIFWGYLITILKSQFRVLRYIFGGYAGSILT